MAEQKRVLLAKGWRIKVTNEAVDVLIPARRGSQGLPGKNRRRFVDRALFLHSVACAELIPQVRRIVVSTDDQELAEIAEAHGLKVPRLRPSDLARPETPMSEVVQFELAAMVQRGESPSPFLLLLDPTSPLRAPGDIQLALQTLEEDKEAVGAIAVSKPSFNPLWVGVSFDTDGALTRHDRLQAVVGRRQDVPDYWRINGSFYVWRRKFATSLAIDWLDRGRHRGIVTAEIRSHSIDVQEDFDLAEILVSSGIVKLDWLEI